MTTKYKNILKHKWYLIWLDKLKLNIKNTKFS